VIVYEKRRDRDGRTTVIVARDRVWEKTWSWRENYRDRGSCSDNYRERGTLPRLWERRESIWMTRS